MNNKRTFGLTLDLKDIDQKVEIVGKVKQLDGTRIVANLLNFGEPMSLSDCLIRMFIKRPDGTELYQKEYIQIEGANTIVIDCVDEIFELIGDVELEIEVIDLDGYIETMPTIKITVLDKINDDTQREIIRIEEISMFEELKQYIENTTLYIDGFKEALDLLADPDYASLVEALGSAKATVEAMGPMIEEQTERLIAALEEATQKELDFSDSEGQRKAAEENRIISENIRATREQGRVSNEIERVNSENTRTDSEIKRISDENLRVNREESRYAEEIKRQQNDLQREANEQVRQNNENQRMEQEINRESEMEAMRGDIEAISDKVDDAPNHGNFNVDVVVKGNLYPTLDGVKPFHAGPPTKNAGNVLMPYARAIGGFTKDGSGVRTIGFIAKPKEANSSLDITEDQNSDAVFLGTNVSQLFLYSKEKYPTIVSQNEVSPIATQDWVMRLVDGLGLLDKGLDNTPTTTSRNPYDIFDTTASDSFSNVNGLWSLDEYNSMVTFADGDAGKYSALIAHPEYNEITYSYTADTSQSMFVGLWRTDNYFYGARIQGHTLSVSYFNGLGERGGAYTLTIREDLVPGDLITIHYNYLNEIWEFYKFDENQEPILIYQLSKFMMSGFPEFENGRSVRSNFALLMSQYGVVNFSDNPSPMQTKLYTNTLGYKF